MAKITPIDVIKGISGKYGSGSKDYFATNKSSNQVRLAKLAHPYKGPATEKQLAHQAQFTARQVAASAWLNANKPSEQNGAKGTEAYQLAQKIKKALHLSNIVQVVHKYMDEEGTIKLPVAHPDLPGGEASPQPSPKGEGEEEDPSQPSL